MSAYVVFFGGFRSSKQDMHLWKVSAERQRPDVKFDAFPYPGHANASASGAAQGFEAQFDGVAKMIGDSGADRLFIVGHSSGCAIANEMNARFKGDMSRITLVDLDGFSPRNDQMQKSGVQAWCAEGVGGKGKSVNWAADKNKYLALRATQPWSLHFSMVNIAATDKITLENFKDTGYVGCMANLCFLPSKL